MTLDGQAGQAREREREHTDRPKAGRSRMTKERLID